MDFEFDHDLPSWGGGTASALSVSLLTRHLAGVVRQDEILQDVWVRGEIASFTRASSGHLYFTLADEGACLSCVMFRSAALFLRFRPEPGMQVLAHGSLSVYAPRGQYQLDVDDLQPDGLGSLHLALEQARQRLLAEGLLDPERRRPLPAFPETVAVITSTAGAAVRDICVTLGRGQPPPTVLVVPAVVQGDAAEGSLCTALRRAATCGADVVILGRGGGSTEDLWAFNSERVARAIAACPVPVISAVGHETDFTLADMIADERAATPTAAAERVLALREEMLGRLRTARERAAAALRSRMELGEARLAGVLRRQPLSRPLWLVESRRQRLDELSARLYRLREGLLTRWRHRVALAAGRLESVSPLATLARGYGRVTRADGLPLTGIQQVGEGEAVTVTLVDGAFDARVTAVRRQERSGED